MQGLLNATDEDEQIIADAWLHQLFPDDELAIRWQGGLAV